MCISVLRTTKINQRMGKKFAKLFGKKDMRILMLGLDAAGKTSILEFVVVGVGECTCVCVWVYLCMFVTMVWVCGCGCGCVGR